jgi:hypothetical protein
LAKKAAARRPAPKAKAAPKSSKKAAAAQQSLDFGATATRIEEFP